MSYQTDQQIRQLKEEVCEVGRRIWQKGFCAGNEGNHSVRVPSSGGAPRFVCTPTGISKGFLDPDDVCVIDENGELVERNTRGRKPSSEIKLHLALYRKRPDVDAVIHSHPPHATAFAVAGIPLPEAIHPEAEVFLGRVESAPYALPSTDALPDSVLPLVKEDTTTVLMGNHGTVTFCNQGLIDCYYKLEIADAYARILLLSKQLGHVNVLNKDQMVDLLRVKENFVGADSRLACAEEGCIGDENQPFITSFDVRPASATCSCDGGKVQSHSTQRSAGETGDRRDASGQPNTDPVFEQMVQTITDRIMAAR